MANHDCTVSGRTGAFGINLTCQNCLRPAFFECIQTRKEVCESMDAFDFMDLQYTSSFEGQQEITNRIKHSLFSPSSVFEFVCVKSKSNGNRFIIAADKQNEQALKLKTVSSELKTTTDQSLFWKFARERINSSTYPSTMNYRTIQKQTPRKILLISLQIAFKHFIFLMKK